MKTNMSINPTSNTSIKTTVTSRISSALALALAVGGCAATNLAAHPTTVADRQETIVTRESPRLLVTGPARLLHVDVSGEGDVRLYRVFVGTSSRSEEACRSAQPIAPILLHGEQQHRLNLEVDPDQAVCVVASQPNHSTASTRIGPTELAWHAERGGHSKPHEHLALGMLQDSVR